MLYFTNLMYVNNIEYFLKCTDAIYPFIRKGLNFKGYFQHFKWQVLSKTWWIHLNSQTFTWKVATNLYANIIKNTLLVFISCSQTISKPSKNAENNCGHFSWQFPIPLLCRRFSIAKSNVRLFFVVCLWRVFVFVENANLIGKVLNVFFNIVFVLRTNQNKYDIVLQYNRAY